MSRELLGKLRSAAAPVAALALGVPLLQHHSIEFLTAWKTGAPTTWDVAMLLAPWSGWGWSLALEIVALWMWYERGAARRAMAALATAALLFGPVYLTISSEAEAWEIIKSDAALGGMDAPRIAEDIAEKRSTLETYRKNSEQRVGWQTQIENAEKELAALREDQKANDRRVLAGQGWPWALIAKAAGWIAIILLCGLANVAAITTLSQRFNMPVQAVEPEPVQSNLHSHSAVQSAASEPNHLNEPVVPPHSVTPRADSAPAAPVLTVEPEPVQSATPPDDLTIKRLQRAVAGAFKKSGLSLNKWCAENGVNKRDLRYLSQHFERSANGEATISQNKLRELIARFLPESKEATQ